jgi:hypothetical protein
MIATRRASTRDVLRNSGLDVPHQAVTSRPNATYRELILFAGVTVGAGRWLG